MKLEGKTAVITGGATGIGAATAELFAAEGATAVVLDYNAAEGNGVCERIAAAGTGGGALFLHTDMRTKSSVAAAFEEVARRYGKLDILMCGAGVLKGAYRGIEELDEEDWDATIDTNLKGTFLATKYGAPLMVAAKKSVLLLISSGAGVRGASSSFAYAASKAGIHGMQYKFQSEYGPRGMRAYVICPSSIATPLKLANIGERAKLSGEDPQQAMAEAMKELGDPNGVARILAFLASDEGSYVTGTIFTR